MVEHRVYTAGVVGSSPAGPTLLGRVDPARDLIGLQVMEEERLAAAMDIYWRVRNAEPEGE